jgi:predicted transposase YbfD/YdcC
MGRAQDNRGRDVSLGWLLADIQQTVAAALDGQLAEGVVRQYTSREQGHGRQEERSCVMVQNVSAIRGAKGWANLTTVGMCRRERTVNGQSSTEVYYFIGSRRMAARRYAQALRSHWGIENNLHWQLDVSFREDASRVENRHGAANLSLLRKLALCVLKQHPCKESIARKRKLAALDIDFLEETLAGATKLDKV